jgi:hypothetical protein
MAATQISAAVRPDGADARGAEAVMGLIKARHEATDK